MNKQMQLIRVLLKCGRTGKAESKNSSVGNNSTLITILIGAALVVALFFGGEYAAEHEAMLGSMNSVFGNLLAMSGVAAFFLTVFNAMNQLYISSDLDVLVTLPFTPGQILFAKLVSISPMPAGICFGMIVPAAVGYSVKASGLSAAFIPAMIAGALLMTLYVLSIAAILLTIVMRVFHFIRSRNLISILSTLFIFAVTTAYFVTRTDGGMDEQQAVGLYRTISGVTGKLGFLFPFAGFVMQAAEGAAVNLLYAAAIVLAALVLMAVCAKLFYFQGALGMTDANGKRGPVSESRMRKLTSKSGVSKTLMHREISQILRTPSLITNGYLYSIIFPFLVLIPIAIKVADVFRDIFTELGLPLTLDGIRQAIEMYGVPSEYLLLGGCVVCMVIPSMAVAFSSLSRFMISREGKDYASLKAMPISAQNLVRIKRNVVLLFNGISGFLIPALAMIALAVLRLYPWWISLICMVVSFAWLLAIVDLCAIKDVQKPNLNWENEAVVTKNNMLGTFVFLALFFAAIGVILLCLNLSGESGYLLTVIAWALVVLPLIAAVVCEIILRRSAEKLYSVA